MVVGYQHFGAPSNQHVLGNDLQHSKPTFPQTRPAGSDGSLYTGFVALGDSYSAGIGTGFKGTEDDCRRGLHSYPRLIAHDLAASQGGPDTTAVQVLSCTGATTDDVLTGGAESQIDSVNASVPIDFALLSVGGNDLGFFDVMNACVFRFYGYYSGACADALATTHDRIESEDFETRILVVVTEILDKVRWEKKPWFVITFTGYARFFNDETDACDDASFGMWWDGPKLSKELRLQMNELVRAVNGKLRKTVDKVNRQFTTDKVLFVDYDEAFDGHRFCEPGVAEPDYERKDTWFFLVNGADNARNDTQANSETKRSLPSSSPLVNPSSCLEPARRSGDWGDLALCYMAMAKQHDPDLRPAPAIEARAFRVQNGMWGVPTSYGQCFHPRSLGHEAIRDKIYEVWRSWGG